jgi:serine/threonine-protein kinase
MIGELLAGRYRIERLLGRGGMGAVYEATHVELSRRVALKVLEIVRSDEGIAAALREARAAAQLAHPHIVAVTDVNTDDGPPFLVMELLQGESLDARLARVGRLSAESAAFIGVQVLSALSAAHAAGIVHRDVKPSNIFLTPTAATNDFVKLVDFGVAWSRDSAAARERTAGTPAYMAPEQIRGEPPEAPMDVWAVGVCLFEMLTGRAPFAADTIAELLTLICDSDAPSIDAAVGTPPSLARIVAISLKRDPRARHSSADEMRRQLAPFARSTPIPSRALGPRDDALELADTIPEPARAGADDATISREEPPAPAPAKAPSSTKASGPLATMVSGTPAPMTTPDARRPRSRALALGASAALALTIGASAMAVRHRARSEHPQPLASSSAIQVPARKTCRIASDPPLAWSPAPGRIDVSAVARDVLVIVEAPEARPQIASGTAGSRALSEWSSPSYAEIVDRGTKTCATSYGREVAVGLAHLRETPRSHGTVFALFTKPDGKTEMMKYGSDMHAHASRRLRCSTAGGHLVFASLGEDSFGFPAGAPMMPNQIRTFWTEGQYVLMNALSDDVSDVVLSADTNALALVAPTHGGLFLTGAAGSPDHRGWPSQMLSQRQVVMEAAAVLRQGELELGWVDDKPRRLHWAHRAVRGGDVTNVAAVEADVFGPALALASGDVVLAYGRREAGRTDLHLGRGRTLEEAASTEGVVFSMPGKEIIELALAVGDVPWLVWAERSGAVHAAVLDCP